MQIYVACLASYNAGVMHGEWIDIVGMGAEDVREEIARILRESPHPNVEVDCPECGGGLTHGGGQRCVVCDGKCKVPSAEEWAIHDYDDVPGEWGEHPDLDKLCEFVEALDELEEDEREAFIAYRDNEGDHVDLESFRDAYAGKFDSWADFAESLIEEQGVLQDVPAELARYFDYESYGRDLRLGGDAHEASGYYFWNR